MLTTELLMGKGYFPKELPPPFTTISIASVLNSKKGQIPTSFSNPSGTTRHCLHNLARPHTLRRKIGIPNPVSYYKLCSDLEANWQQIELHVHQSPLAICLPYVRPNAARAFTRDKRHAFEPTKRAELRSTARYVLKTDVANFYGSIYTHSIPWALHSKSTAKMMRRPNQLFGNAIDQSVRNCQDGQTIGIPIGPDTSDMIAEIILAAVDQELPAPMQRSGYRYMDDYEFAFKTRAEANAAVARFQIALSNYELDLNPNKTDIIELPIPIEDSWASHLRIIPISRQRRSQRYHLVHYFAQAFTYFQEHKGEYVLRYAISKASATNVHSSNWDLYQNLLYQCMMAEPGCIRFVIDQLIRYEQAGYPIAFGKLAEVFNEIIAIHAPVGHGSEVAWALWGCLLFDLKILAPASKLIVEMDDCVVALLALDARHKGLFDPNASFSLWENYMSPADLRDSMWLLAYEAGVKNWLPSVGGIDHIGLDPDFDFLRNHNVYFYDDNAASTTRASPAVPPSLPAPEPY